ncbi:hypothetical protein FAM23282_01399 [Lentilactobacillus parabuchneri]|uniref:hypothetical protein n=1 Tax=Lentilactobacillus parabuchneri TaxID=152331 RepID=UPI000A0FD87C|nr:hypothetical protein [Lentilactobacillus parabuchneri]ORN39561.1 hypothetical protein FAM23282_01399 [Lentilactobacillus parabuchneri]
MNERYKKTLQQQLHLLSESSKKAQLSELSDLTIAMIQVIDVLNADDQTTLMSQNFQDHELS